MHQEDNNSGPKLTLALVLSGLILIGWYYFFDKSKSVTPQAHSRQKIVDADAQHTAQEAEDAQCVEAPKIRIASKELEGTISLRGARIDDLYLNSYKNNINPNSGSVHLLAPSGEKESYFTEFGWIADGTVEVPTSSTIWHTNHEEISPSTPLELKWRNKAGDLFMLKISMDEDYMFFVEQSFTNHSGQAVEISCYGLANKAMLVDKNNNNTILHQGAIAAIDGSLEEYSYDKLKDDKIKKFNNKKVDWVGISDKYWLVAFIPDQEYTNDATFQFANQKNIDKVQIDFVTDKIKVAPNKGVTFKHKMFAGAKQVKLLDKYSKEYNINLFDRTIDFGWLYMITKPLFYALTFCYSLVGNFGISILIITVIIKILMFGLTTKSYRSMKKLRDLQPKMEQLKQQYGNDKIKFTQSQP